MFDFPSIRSAVRYEGGISRRLFLAYGAALASLPRLEGRAFGRITRRLGDDPFTLGVASGEPDESSVVLWTRLAPKPLEQLGGMKPENVEVTWEIADDEGIKSNVKTGTAIATPQLGHSLRVVVEGLRPDRWYFYRFHAGDATSPVGRTRTTPECGATPEKLNFAFASCQH